MDLDPAAAQSENEGALDSPSKSNEDEAGASSDSSRNVFCVCLFRRHPDCCACSLAVQSCVLSSHAVDHPPTCLLHVLLPPVLPCKVINLGQVCAKAALLACSRPIAAIASVLPLAAFAQRQMFT